ncbi:hypothetical protein TNCV_2245801 [Trichonephila clavipes]|uniref:Uncharacterized protein n=1 Tax=Trichonephila clavipes TaxID=2585209 RepID=A0A8X6R7Y5_TRICX|nr:hypothetical protein TNCV_2245801 [Trichonephila clavipes]
MVYIFKKIPLKSAKFFSDETIGLATEKEALASVSCSKNKPDLNRLLLTISIRVLTKTVYHMARKPTRTINSGLFFLFRAISFLYFPSARLGKLPTVRHQRIMGSYQVQLKIHHVEEPAQVSSSSLDRGSKLRYPSPITLVLLCSVTLIYTQFKATKKRKKNPVLSAALNTKSKKLSSWYSQLSPVRRAKTREVAFLSTQFSPVPSRSQILRGSSLVRPPFSHQTSNPAPADAENCAKHSIIYRQQ